MKTFVQNSSYPSAFIRSIRLNRILLFIGLIFLSFSFTEVEAQPPVLSSTSNSTVCLGTTVSFTANVGGATSGNITFYVDGIAQAPTVPVDGSGNATFTTNALTQGSHTITATWDGDATNTQSNPITETITSSTSISYSAASYCQNGTPNTQVPTLVGTTGGQYSSTGGLTLDPGTGTITLNSSTPGPYTITYTDPGGCQVSTDVLIAAPPSATISYSGSPFCSGAGTGTVTLTGTTGGVFSSTAGLVIDAASGDIDLTNSTPATYTVTYTIAAANGCAAFSTTTQVIINQTPTITATPATQTACSGANFTTIVFGSNVAGTAYNWIRDNTTFLIGMNPAGPGGTTTIPGALTNTQTTVQTSNFTIIASANGCAANPVVASVTVNPAPTVAAITGSASVCQAGTTQLNDATAGGVWSSDNTAVATVSGTGLVTGVTAGSANIIYTYTDGNGCKNSVTQSMSVNPAPTVTATATPASICVGQSSSISATSPGNVATTVCQTNNAQQGFQDNTPITPLYKTVTFAGIPAGITLAQITNISLTVNVLHQRDHEVEMYLIAPGGTSPLTTAGAANGFQLGIQPGFSIRLGGNQGGNTANFTNTVFSSAGTQLLGAAGVYPTTGSFTGTYAPFDAFSTLNSTINPNGTWTVVFLDHVNSGYTGVFQNFTLCLTYGSNNGTFTWTSSPAGYTNTGPGPFTVTPATTTDYIATYTASNGCSAQSTATVTVNPLPTISGTLSVCAGATTQLTGSGTPAATTPWVSGTTGVATVSNTGLVTGVAAGTSVITYTNNNGCKATATVTVTAAPTVTGTLTVCVGNTTQLTGNGTPAAVNPWVSATPGVATVSNTGLVTGISQGTSLITYTNSNGCSKSVTVTVNPTPTITGTLTVCVGSTTQLTGSGTPAAVNPWVSGTTAVATVSNTGLVTAVAPGTSVITFTNNSGCKTTATVTVNAKPTITGTLTVCVGSTTQLTGSGVAAAINPWVSGNTGVATVSNTGLVTGVAGGTSVITYTNNNGCTVNATVTVNALPTITGTLSVCVGKTTQLTGSGTAAAINPWVSGTTSVATVSNTGLVTAVGPGTTIITYTNNNGCANTVTVTVNANPTITGTLTVCVGNTTQLTGSGTPAAVNPWISGTTGVATVSNTGLVTGVGVGTSVITYTNSSGCTATATVTVTSAPTITGTLTVCTGSTTQLTGSGTPAATSPWVSASPGVATVSNTGLVSGLTGGTSIITYTNNNGCSVSVTVTVNTAPTVTTGGPYSVCAGGSVTLAGTIGGGATSSLWSAPTGTFSNANSLTSTYSPSIASGNVTLTLTSNAPAGCSPATATVLVIVKAANTAGAPSSNPTLCINTALTNITIATTGATGIGAATGLPAGVTATWAANTITISGTPSAAGVFTYSIPLTGGCGAVNATGTITVTAANTAGAPSSNPTLCINTALTNITIATTGATGIGAATGLPAGVTATWAANTITITGTPTAAGTFNYTIPLTGGCGAATATGTITVNDLNTAGAPSSNPTVCINTALTNITIATTGATGIGAATGLPAGVTATWAANTITISGTPTAAGTFNYTIPLTGGCGAATATGTITVTDLNTAGVPSSNPTVCINTALTNITIATTGATGIGAATGLPAGVTASWAANKITISGTPSAAGVFTYSIPLTGGCGAVNATGTITVTAANTAGAPSSNPTLCINTALTNITIATTGATGIGAATGLPAGVTATWAANTITISGTPTAAGTFNYTIPLTGGCGAATATGTITVTAANTAGVPSSNPTLCINTALTNITIATTGATGIGAATGLPAGVTATWAANTITITGIPTAAGTFNYTIPLTGGCGAATATGTITVNDLNTAGVPSSNPTLCINTALTNITIATTGATGIGAATGLPAGVTATWAANTITITGTPTAAGTFNYTIPLTGGCGAATATGTITVNDLNTAAAPSSNPTLCINTALTNITIATTGATGIGAATGLPAGVTATWAANTITISGTPTAAGTFNYTIPLTGGCGAATATGTITVTAANTAGAPSSNPTLCINTALTNITIATTGATGIGAATGLPAGVTATWAANTITITGTPTAAGTFNYTIPLTGGCGAATATGTITVNDLNTAAAPSSNPT